MQQYFELSDALIKSGGVIWDDHNGGSEGKLFGLAALFTGKEVIPVALHKADYFSLNRVYLKDGKVHLSDESVAGTLFPVNFAGDVWDCINDYNEKQIGNKFSCGTLENPMGLEPVPVTVITMTIAEFKSKILIERSDDRKDILEKVLSGDVKVKGSLLPEAEHVHLKLGARRPHRPLNADFHPTDGVGDFPDKPNS